MDGRMDVQKETATDERMKIMRERKGKIKR